MKQRKIYSCILLLASTGVALMFKRNRRKQNKINDKYFIYYDLLNKWMKQKEKGVLIAEKLKQKGIKEIAIYGMGDIARHLQHELKDTDITVKYAIDKSELSVIDIDKYLPDSELPQVDAVVVTPVLEYVNIDTFLKQKISCPIICIVDLIEGLGEYKGENR